MANDPLSQVAIEGLRDALMNARLRADNAEHSVKVLQYACRKMLAAFRHIPLPDDGTEAARDLWNARKLIQEAIAASEA